MKTNVKYSNSKVVKAHYKFKQYLLETVNLKANGLYHKRATRLQKLPLAAELVGAVPLCNLV